MLDPATTLGLVGELGSLLVRGITTRVDAVDLDQNFAIDLDLEKKQPRDELGRVDVNVLEDQRADTRADAELLLEFTGHCLFRSFARLDASSGHFPLSAESALVWTPADENFAAAPDQGSDNVCSGLEI